LPETVPKVKNANGYVPPKVFISSTRLLLVTQTTVSETEQSNHCQDPAAELR